MRLRAMAVDLPEVPEHPNRVAFEGVLTVVDEPSTRAPSGARGHRVVLTRAAALAGLPFVGLTAWQALFDLGKLTAGQRVLVNGAGDAVGGLLEPSR